MGQVAILLQRTKKPEAVCNVLRARAARMRDIAMMLSAQDASILQAYAGECEAEAAQLLAPQRIARAA